MVAYRQADRATIARRLRGRLPARSAAAGRSGLAAVGHLRRGGRRRRHFSGRPCATARQVQLQGGRQELLPGPLSMQARGPTAMSTWRPTKAIIRLLAKFRALRGNVPWEAFPVFRFWQFAKLMKGVQVVLPYSDGRPAIVEKAAGQGARAVDDHAGLRADRSLERRPLEPAADRLRAVAVRDARQRAGAVPGRRQREPIELYGRPDGQVRLEGDKRFPTYQVQHPRRTVPARRPKKTATRSPSPTRNCRATTASRPAASRESISASASTCRPTPASSSGSSRPN